MCRNRFQCIAFYIFIVRSCRVVPPAVHKDDTPPAPPSSSTPKQKGTNTEIEKSNTTM